MNNLSSSMDHSFDVGHTNQQLSRVHIQNLFLDIAKRIDEKSLLALKKFIPIDEIIYEISGTEPILLIQYVKQIAFYLSKVKMELEEKIQRSPEVDDQNNYESLIQKLEADVRQHIRIEQQQRLHIENLQQQLDETLSINIEKDYELELKDQEMRDMISRINHPDHLNRSKIQTQRESIQKGNDLIVKNLNNVQKVNQTNYINNIHIQPRHIPISSNDSSAPSLINETSLTGSKGNAADKLNDLISIDHHHKQSSQRNRNTTTDNSIQQLPLQLKALFNKVYHERDLNSSQTRSQQSKRNIQRIQSSKLKHHNETSYKDEQQTLSKNYDSQDITQLVQKRTQSYHGQKDGQISYRNKVPYNVTRNLESQFIESDRMRDELFKQFGQAQYNNFQMGYKDNAKRIDKNHLSDQNYLMKKEQIQHSTISNDRKEKIKQELSKSSSFDGTSNKMVKQYKRDVKSQAQPIPQPQNSSLRSTQNIGNYIKKKTIY